MNLIERYLVGRLHKVAWKSLTHQDESMTGKATNRQLKKYHWIIKNSSDQIIFDTEKDGYEGLVSAYPVVLEAMEMVEKNKKDLKNRSGKEKTKVVYRIAPNLSTFFPSKQLEEKYISA
ncbi:MAG: hypothetical protein IJ716_09480 [Lachnospiraceae bacterium]|nr:hypothetical protein [Lachnospiraceae bacterium]